MQRSDIVKRRLCSWFPAAGLHADASASCPGCGHPTCLLGLLPPNTHPGRTLHRSAPLSPDSIPRFSAADYGILELWSEILRKFLEDYLGASTDQAFYDASAATVEPGTSDCSTLIAQTVANCVRNDHKTLPSILEVYFTTYLYLKGAQWLYKKVLQKKNSASSWIICRSFLRVCPLVSTTSFCKEKAMES